MFENLGIYASEIAIISVIISCTALFHSFYVNKYFIKKQLSIDQIRQVNKLIEYLNNQPIEMFWGTFESETSSGGKSGNYTIFDISGFYQQDPLSEEFDESIILFHSKSNQILEILPFINNPLIPKSISDELTKLFSTRYTNYNRKNIIGEKCLFLETNIFRETIFQRLNDERSDVYKFSNAIALQTWLSLKTTCYNLSKSLERWYQEVGKTEPNIRSDFHFNS